MSKRALARVDAWIVELLQATGSSDLLTEKDFFLIARSRQGRAAFPVDPRSKSDIERLSIACVDEARIDLLQDRATKDLAIPSLQFDVRQSILDDET